MKPLKLCVSKFFKHFTLIKVISTQNLLFFFADSSLFFCEFDQFFIDGQPFLASDVVHVLPGDVVGVGFVTEVKQLLLGPRNPERVGVEYLPVAEDQLRHGQTGRLFPENKSIH